jgi:hypothetical protein
MRFLPLLPSSFQAAPWLGFREVELDWDGALGAGWAEAVRHGFGIHAIHLRPLPWKDPLLEEARAALSCRLGIDFLVLRVEAPSSRWAAARFFGILEGLLEVATPLGVKVVLRPAPGSTAPLLALLQEAKADGVGFCWDESLDDSLNLIADRVRCAVGTAAVDPGPLQHWGYRWNMAVPGTDPERLGAVLADLRTKHPAVLFPAVMPTHALGRPVLPDPEVSLGRIWNREEP